MGALNASGQTASYTDTLTLALGDTVLLAPGNLVPLSDTLLIRGNRVQRTYYAIRYDTGQLWLLDARFAGVPIVVRYRAFATPLPGPQRLLARPDSVASDAGKPQYDFSWLNTVPEGYGAIPTDTTGPKWKATAKLQRSGSIARAVTVGTGRDASVTSDFRLNLNGTLANDIGITASITDENLPIQPSGTTQQLTDFDQIFIRLTKGNNQLTFGDLELQQTGGYFTNYYRDVLGLAYRYKDGPKEVRVGGASSKGSFTSNSFLGENGKQGPYRLTGRAGEAFRVILAGSERVYLNGRLLERGQDRDYTIDYNLGELTFTPANVIDANTRVVVDFTYADRAYARSFLTASYADSLFNDRLALRVSYVREADDATAPIDLSLSDADRAALAAAPDTAQFAEVSGIDTVGFSATDVRYAIVDTLIDGVLYPGVLVVSRDSLQAIYEVSFTFVGTGQGDYVRDGSTTNANRFRFSPPLSDGTQTGNYAPIRRLPLPSLTQVFQVAADYRIGGRLHIFTETAISDYSPNRLATQQTQASTGIATRMGLRLAPTETTQRPWQLTGEAAFQYVEEQYQNVDRVYAKEYGRRWNYDDLAPRATERLAEGTLAARYRNRLNLSLQGGYRAFGDSLRTSRVEFKAASRDSASLVGDYRLTYLNTDNLLGNDRSTWLRQQGTVAHLLGGRRREKGWQIGSRFWIERRDEVRNDTLSEGSFGFADFTPFLATYGPRKLNIELSTNLRTDQGFGRGTLIARSRTFRPKAAFNYAPNQRLLLRASGTWQDFTLLDTLFETGSVRTLRGWLFDSEARYYGPDRALQVNLFYRAATEQVAERALAYIEVPAGQGQFEWRDYNGDGIEDLNEFERSTNPLLANYIRILNPTQELRPAVGITLGGNLRYAFKDWFKEEPSGPLRLLYHMSSQTVLRARQQADRPSEALGSYGFDFRTPELTDSNVISSVYSLRQEVYFFRNQPRGDFSFGLAESRQQQLLGTGVERTETQVLSARQRYNFARRHTIEQIFQLVDRDRLTDAFDQSSYTLNGWSTQPSYAFQLSARTRLGAGIAYGERQARVSAELGGPSVSTFRFSLDGRFTYGKRNSIVCRASAVQNRLNGMAEGNLRFDLLESLEPGQNAVWNLLWVQYLSQTLELSTVYDGRAAASLIPQHAIRMQLRALF